MADVVLTHKFVPPRPQGADPTLVSKDAWTDDHDLDGGSAYQVVRRKLGGINGAEWVWGRELAGLPSCRALMSALDAGLSASWGVIGDSTGNAPDEWVYLTAQWFATRYPALTVKYHLWNDATQRYDQPTTIQLGAAGERYADFNGVGAMRMAHEDVALTALTGTIDIRAKILPDDWTPTIGNYAIVARLNDAAGQYTLRLMLTTLGRLYYQFSADGTNLVTGITSTVSVSDTGATPQWVRAVHIPSSTLVRFYTSPDGITFTQLGTDVAITAGNPYTGNNGTYDTGIDDWTIGATGTGTNRFVGKIYTVEIRNGIDGALVAPANIEAWSPQNTTSTFGGAPEMHVVNGSHGGATVAYFSDATRAPKAFANYGQLVTFLSLGHNEQGSIGAGELARYGTLLTTLKSYLPATAPVVLTQNPQIAPSTRVQEHGVRMPQLQAYAVRSGYDVVDVFRAFHVAGPETVVSADGIHPNAAGNALWAGVIQDILAQS